MVLKLITNKLFNMSRLEQVNGQYAKTLLKVCKFERKIAYLCVPLQTYLYFGLCVP